MQDVNLPSRDTDYTQLIDKLINSESPINYSLEYLLENYGDRAIPAMLQALPVRPWYEQRIILEALGKLGDLRALVPVCALLYDQANSSQQLENSITNTLRNIVYYSQEKKKATDLLIDTAIRYRQCINSLTLVLKDQKNKYTIKSSYKKLFKQEQDELKQSAITIIGDEDGFTSYRIKYLKKILSRLKDAELRDSTIAALKVLISKKRCERLCKKKGMKFYAFFRRPDNNCYDCCCVDRNDKRVIIKFDGGLIPGKNISHKSHNPNTIRALSARSKPPPK